MTEEKAPFNSAIDKLMSLSEILREIIKLENNVMLSEADKQFFKIKLVKQYYINSYPLLSDNAKKIYKSVLDIEPKTIKVTDRNGKVIRTSNVYDNELDNDLNKFLIVLQNDLQDKGKYFMPPRRDPSRAIAEF